MRLQSTDSELTEVDSQDIGADDLDHELDIPTESLRQLDLATDLQSEASSSTVPYAEVPLSELVSEAHGSCSNVGAPDPPPLPLRFGRVLHSSLPSRLCSLTLPSASRFIRKATDRSPSSAATCSTPDSRS